ncbi:phytoene desaturase family protein [Halobacteriales archaeon Cl-PHB]
MSDLVGTSVTVVGGGVGGLSAAAYLADGGADVRLLEKNEQLGGRASRLHLEGFRFDMGPSWYLMPDVFERFFGHFGHEPADFYDLDHLDPHYRIFFTDGDEAEVTGDRAELRDLFESYEDGAGEAFEDYLDTSQRHYETSMEHFVYEDRSRLRDWVDLDVLRAAPVGLSLIGSMDRHVSKYVDHPKLQQILQYTLVFLGGAPKNTPALYNIMSHVDVNLGVHYPDGGMGAVVDGLVDLGGDLGVTYETDSEVKAVTKGRDGFIVETTGGEYRPDAVVANADYAHFEQDLLPEHERQYDADYWDERTYAPSAYLLYLGVEGDVDPLAHHTLILPPDWDGHFETIFDDPSWPDDPAFYVCAPSRTDDSVAPSGHSALFVLVPIAPGLEDSPASRDACRDHVLEAIADHAGVDLRDRIVVEEEFCVSDFVDRYNATEGTALGLAHTLRQTSLLRPSNRSSAVDGLYFTGSYTTPGIGVPMCLISGEHAADALCEDYAT